jgi:Sulfatase
MTTGLPRYRARFVHLTALWAYGVSQPVFALINGNPELLFARNATRLDVAEFAVLVAVVPPALATAYVWFAGRLSRWVADKLYLFVLGMCLVPVATRGVKLVDPGLVVALSLVALMAGAGAVLYARSHAARLFLGYSIVLPLAALVWFVHGLPTLADEANAASVQVKSRVPVVFVVLDELPVSSLMTRRGEIDAVRYPNFARLARRGTWYPNATTVREWTSDAIPSILTGRIGHKSTLPTFNHYPENLFSLLGGAYTLKVHETFTQLCPQEYCRRARSSLLENSVALFRDSWPLLVPRILPTSVSGRLVRVNSDLRLESDSSRALARFNELVAGISGNDPEAVLYYSHLLLPHAPWMFLPSGAQYDFRGMDGWFPDEHWDDEPWLVLQGYQRHLLQVGYVDRLLGRLMRRLEQQDLYDRSLVVVVADHGTSFRAGEGRRPLTGHNVADITSVPLFVKYPRQRHGRIDSRTARTTDLLPTVAEVLGIRLPWRVDGESLLGKASRRSVVVVARRGGLVEKVPIQEMIRDRAATIAHKSAEFGEGHDSLYRIGANKWLLGRQVAGLQRSRSIEVRIDKGDQLQNVRLESGYLPARISGQVTSGRIEPGAELAVAVNGRVEALTQCFWSNGRQRFRAFVPETALREGSNQVDVFLVGGRSAGALVGVGTNVPDPAG